MINISIADKESFEKYSLLLHLGCLEALSQELVDISEVEQLVFRRETGSVSEKNKSSISLIDLFDAACELKDVEDLVPHLLKSNINELKEKAIKELSHLTSSEITEKIYYSIKHDESNSYFISDRRLFSNVPNSKWLGMDKNGKIAVFENFQVGHFPAPIKTPKMLYKILGYINQYIFDEFTVLNNTQFDIDLYSSFLYSSCKTLQEAREYTFNYACSIKKGVYIYQAIRSFNDKKRDYPVGYKGTTKNGDYFRYIVPTSPASIMDFPKYMHKMIMVSDNIDFTVDQILDNNLIIDNFTKAYSK